MSSSKTAFINRQVFMNNMRLLSLTALVAVACSEAPTSPSGVITAKSVANAAAFRPPPPLETIGESSEYSSFNATYFLNGPENNGWISFSSQQPAGTSLSTPSARISFHNGTLSGKGVLTLTGAGGSIVIDLKTGVAGASLFGSCYSSCGSLSLTGTLYRGAVNTGLEKTITANLRNPAFRGEVGIGDVYYFNR